MIPTIDVVAVIVIFVTPIGYLYQWILVQVVNPEVVWFRRVLVEKIVFGCESTSFKGLQRV